METIILGLSLQDCKKIVLAKEKERHKDDMRIFYPDPCNEDDCAQCGKHKNDHQKDLGNRPFFCKTKQEQKPTPEYLLMDEAAEMYADNKLKTYASRNR